MRIVAVIPTYNSETIDLCIQSALAGIDLEDTIVMVHVDGNKKQKDLIEKYNDMPVNGEIQIHVTNLNIGLPASINKMSNIIYGSLREGESSDDVLVLFINDDNVFPKSWDSLIISDFETLCKRHPNSICLSPNQIEPKKSIFKQFWIQDLGDFKSFDLGKFYKFNNSVAQEMFDVTGYTFPYVITLTNCIQYPWDITFPKTGVVADVDFFYRLQTNNISGVRTYSCNFYHFVSMTVNDLSINSDSNISRATDEIIAHKYFFNKYGHLVYRDGASNKFSIR